MLRARTCSDCGSAVVNGNGIERDINGRGVNGGNITSDCGSDSNSDSGNIITLAHVASYCLVAYVIAAAPIVWVSRSYLDIYRNY